MGGWGIGCLVLVLALPGFTVFAQQQNEPRIGYVYPAGGRQGSTFTVTIGGRFLDGVGGVMVSGDGIAAKVIAHDKPPTPRQINELREKMRSLQERAADASVRTELNEIRRRIAEAMKRSANPVLAELVTLEVTIEPGARAGARMMRLHTLRGLSNPLVFDVGQAAEFREPDESAPGAAPLSIAVPAVINGRIVPGEDDPVRFAGRQGPQYRPGDIDRYTFTARKGQQMVVSVAARTLMPYLGDAVPGWFQATVAILDGRGREIVYADDFHFSPDPVVRCAIPADGEYVLEIKDALLRGREDFVYRVAIDEWRGERQSRRDTGHEDVGEREPNDSVSHAQRVRTPAVVTGRIARAGDTDAYGFRGRRGEQVVVEVIARRAGSPVDSLVELLDSSGHRVAVNDDCEQPAWGLSTHDADSCVMVALPADGNYTIRVTDIQRKGGAEYAYRLRIGAPRPDFELRVVPSAINGAAGATVPVDIQLRRIDGFDGDVAIALKDAPRGFALSGGLVAAGQQTARVMLTIPPRAPRETFPIAIVGTAVIGSRMVTREAVPADDLMQAFAYHHLVAADGLFVTVRGGRR